MKIVLLNTATLPVYCSELASLLTDAVAHGASVGYTAQVSHADAESYFYNLRTDIDRGTLLLWMARDDSGVIGTVQLALCQKPNGLNRAEIQKLLVHSRAHRQGIGQRLIATLEQEAQQQQHRGLLYLDTQAGSPAEAFYRTQGYRCLGELPDFACTPDGHYHPTAIYYKRLFTANQVTRIIAS